MYDLAILGGGPAGVSAGVYAGRKQLKTVLLTCDFGGQSMISPDIRNWIGSISIPGFQLAQNFEKHVREYTNCVDIQEHEYISNIEKTDEGFLIKTEKGNEYNAKTVLYTLGADRRKLSGVKGAEEYEHKGITYCASCDGPFFADKHIVVIGGGNAGLETAAQLLEYTKSVTILNRGEKYKADAVTVDKVLSHKNAKGILNAEICEVYGNQLVQGIKYKDENGDVQDIECEGVFVEIGIIPNNTQIDFVKKDNYNRIIVDPKTQRTSAVGVWAAGDVTDALYHQNNIASGDGVKALEDIYLHLRAR